MPVRILPAAVAAAALTLAAGPTRAEPGKPSEKEILLLGHWSARAVPARVYLPPADVALASVAAGGGTVVTTGTLSVAAGQPPAYDPAPADRLVVKSGGRTVAEYTITELAGDLSGGGNTFFSGNHSLKCRVVAGQEMDMEVTVARTGGRYVNWYKGWITFDKRRYDVDAGAKGESHFDNDSTGFESRDDHTITGTVTGAGLVLTLDETVHFQMVGAGNESASFDWRKINNKVAAGDTTYQWDRVFLKKNFKNGKMSGVERDPSDWVCEGRVTAGGRTVARYARDLRPLQAAGTGHVVYQVEAAGGPVEVERWRLPGESPDIPLGR